MNMRYGWMLFVAALVCNGCRRPDPMVDLLESELRWMEDQLYLAEDEYRLTSEQLASCHRENSSLRKAGTGYDTDTFQPGGSQKSTRSDGASLPGEMGEEPADLSPPRVEEGELIEPEVEIPGPTDLPLDINIHPTSAVAEVDDQVDAHVTHVVFNSRLTGGVDLDGQPGDDGLLLVIEPRNADGQYVALPGPVSVVVLDPAKRGSDARVARWDFDSVETARHLKKTLFGRGFHLELPWPNDPPESERLRVYVRYTTVDGRKLDADREIEVESAKRIVGGWMPASKARTTAATGDSWAASTAANGAEVSHEGQHASGADQNAATERTARGSERLAPVPNTGGTQQSVLSQSRSPNLTPSRISSRPPRRFERQDKRPRRPTWRPYR